MELADEAALQTYATHPAHDAWAKLDKKVRVPRYHDLRHPGAVNPLRMDNTVSSLNSIHKPSRAPAYSPG